MRRIFIGPPVPGAPWERMSRLLLRGRRGLTAAGAGTPQGPAAEQPNAPGQGKRRPFINRIPRTSDERRLARSSEQYVDIFNSLIRQGVLLKTQHNPPTWTIVAGEADSIDGSTGLILIHGITSAQLSDPSFTPRELLWVTDTQELWMRASNTPITNVLIGPGAGGSGVADGDYGDITVSSSGSVWTIDSDAVTTNKILNAAVTTAKIADSNVTTAKIADSNVTYAKIQDVSAASRLLGRGSASSGVVQEIQLGSGLGISGTTISVAAGGGDRWTEIVASVDQTVTNSTTRVADNELTFAIASSGDVYHVELYLIYSGSDSNGDFKWAFTFPTSSGYIRYNGGNDINDNNQTVSLRMASVALHTEQTSGTDSADTPRVGKAELMIRAEASGTFAFSFALAAAAIGRTATRRAGSVLRYRKIV